jgi:hypothetical protein
VADGSTFRASVIDSATGGLPICEPLGPSPASGTWETNTSGTGSSSATAAAAAGFSAHSVDANIVDNQLGGPPAVPALSAGGRAILVLVLAGLGLTGYRRLASVV